MAKPVPTPVWKRWWFWLLMSPLVCCFGSGLLIGYVRLTLDSNPVYISALKRANASGEAKLRLGSPITVTGVDGFKLSMRGDAMVLDVQGPKGTGKLVAAAKGQEADSLEIFRMAIRVDATGQIISLDGMSNRSSADDF